MANLKYSSNYNPASVAISGGGINGTTLGNITPAAVSATTLSASGLINSNYTLTAETGAVNDASDKPGDLFYHNANSTAGSGAGISFIRTWLNSYDLAVKVSNGASAITAARFSPTGLAVTGALSSTATSKTGGYTVATLPAGAIGQCCYVTDSLAPTWHAIVASGGAVATQVFNNGVNWVCS